MAARYPAAQAGNRAAVYGQSGRRPAAAAREKSPVSAEQRAGFSEYDAEARLAQQVADAAAARARGAEAALAAVAGPNALQGVDRIRFLTLFGFQAESEASWGPGHAIHVTAGTQILLEVAVTGHEESDGHTWYVLSCALWRPAVDFGRAEWVVHRRLSHVREGLHEIVKQRLGSDYAEHFGAAPFARSGGLPGTTARLRGWCQAFTRAANAGALPPGIIACALRLFDAPARDPAVVALGRIPGIGGGLTATSAPAPASQVGRTSSSSTSLSPKAAVPPSSTGSASSASPGSAALPFAPPSRWRDAGADASPATASSETPFAAATTPAKAKSSAAALRAAMFAPSPTGQSAAGHASVSSHAGARKAKEKDRQSSLDFAASFVDIGSGEGEDDEDDKPKGTVAPSSSFEGGPLADVLAKARAGRTRPSESFNGGRVGAGGFMVPWPESKGSAPKMNEEHIKAADAVVEDGSDEKMEEEEEVVGETDGQSDASSSEESSEEAVEIMMADRSGGDSEGPRKLGQPSAESHGADGKAGAADTESADVVGGPHHDEGLEHNLRITFVKARHLKHLNYSGDAPWCVCEVLHADEGAKKTSCKTSTKSNTLEPDWNESCILSPWHVGEALQFTVHDKGMVGSKTSGYFVLPSRRFYPNGFDGQMKLEGGGLANLHVRVQLEASAEGFSGGIETPAEHVKEVEVAAAASEGAPQGVPREDEAAMRARLSSKASTEGEARTSRTLQVTIVKAGHLRHLNVSGDSPWCACEVLRKGRRSRNATGFKTEALKNTLDPEWNETHSIEGWAVGDALEFTIYNQGLLSSRTEGRVILESDRFFPDGFEGDLTIDGVDGGTLSICIGVADCVGS